MTDDTFTLRRILRGCRTIAGVGLSAEWFDGLHSAGTNPGLIRARRTV